MSNGSMHIGLRARERLYINGAVIRVDRKVSIELLNDVSFLLEAHVMQPEETTTPLTAALLRRSDDHDRRYR